jgi:hypothetical protein
MAPGMYPVRALTSVDWGTADNIRVFITDELIYDTKLHHDS